MKRDGTWETAGDGIQRRLVAAGEHLMATEVRFEQGAIGVEHAHPHEQLTYVRDGRFRFTLGGEAREVGPGEFILIPGNVVHGVLTLSAGTLLDTFTPLRRDLIEETNG